MVAAKIVASYLHHLRSITVIRQLISLIAAAQQHRGANLALLEGDKSFSDTVASLQNEINNRFTTLQLLNQELSEPIPAQEVRTLLQEWETVRDWAGGTALENFNLHSNFIEQQMKLMWQVTEQTNCFLLGVTMPKPASPETSSPPQGESSAGDTLLVQFILLEIPEFMELLARVRGLATHACVIGASDPEHSSWLDYLLKQLNLKKERFRVLSKSLQRYLRDVPALIDLQIQDARIVQLIHLVENKILHQHNIDIKSHHIFNMATNIINAQTEVIRQGLDFIQNKIHRQLDDWCYAGPV